MFRRQHRSLWAAGGALAVLGLCTLTWVACRDLGWSEQTAAQVTVTTATVVYVIFTVLLALAAEASADSARRAAELTAGLVRAAADSAESGKTTMALMRDAAQAIHNAAGSASDMVDGMVHLVGSAAESAKSTKEAAEVTWQLAEAVTASAASAQAAASTMARQLELEYEPILLTRHVNPNQHDREWMFEVVNVGRVPAVGVRAFAWSPQVDPQACDREAKQMQESVVAPGEPEPQSTRFWHCWTLAPDHRVQWYVWPSRDDSGSDLPERRGMIALNWTHPITAKAYWHLLRHREVKFHEGPPGWVLDPWRPGAFPAEPRSYAEFDRAVRAHWQASLQR